MTSFRQKACNRFLRCVWPLLAYSQHFKQFHLTFSSLEWAFHRADYDNTLAKLSLSDSGCLTGVIKNYTSQSGTVLQNGNFLTVNHLDTRNRISFVPSVMFSFFLPWFLVTLRRKFQFKSCATEVCLFPLKISTENWGATAQN